MVMALVSIVHSITSLPEEFRTAMEIASLCTSIPIYFSLSMEGAPFCWGFEAEHSKPTPRGAPFYIASRNRKSALCRSHFPLPSLDDEIAETLRRSSEQDADVGSVVHWACRRIKCKIRCQCKARNPCHGAGCRARSGEHCLRSTTVEWLA